MKHALSSSKFGRHVIPPLLQSHDFISTLKGWRSPMIKNPDMINNSVC